MLSAPRMPPRFGTVTWLYIASALVMGWFVPRVQEGRLGWVNPTLRPDQVIAFLSAVSTGMMTFTGIVFSLLFILMQFGSSAYSPHLVAALARNRVLVHAQGVFTGTFLYSLMALRGVGAAGGQGTTAFTNWAAFAWLLASVYLLVRLVGVFATLNIADVLDMLGDTGRREIERVYAQCASMDRPPVRPAARATQVMIHGGRPQYVLGFDVNRFVRLARSADAVIRVPISVGDPLTTGTTVAVVEGSGALVPEEQLRKAIFLGRDRTVEYGPKHAIRLLVDIGIRALSPAVNDPTTAVHTLDEIEDLLVRLGRSQLEIGTVVDGTGVVRLVYSAPTFEEYVELGLAEIQQYGAAALQVERRIAAVLDHLRKSLPAARHPVVDRMDREREAIVKRAFEHAPLRFGAERCDRQGLGHTLAVRDGDGL